MDNRVTLYHKARLGDFEIGDVYENIERCKEISQDLNITDVINPTSKEIGLLAELLYRVKNMPELEIVDFIDIETNQIPN